MIGLTSWLRSEFTESVQQDSIPRAAKLHPRRPGVPTRVGGCPSPASASPAANVSEGAAAHQDLTASSHDLPATFRRLVARRTGRSFREVAEVEKVAMLQPGKGEVLIRVAYAGINGGCEMFRARGEHAFVQNRGAAWFALGAEGAGTVVALGEGVTNLAVGQHVTFIGGAFSEYAAAQAALCWPVAAATPEAVALTISATVAEAALHAVAGLCGGETVLVTAAGGATGSFAAQLAQLAGCRVVATCGGELKAERLRALGLERVIDHRKEDVSAVLQREYPGRIDVAYEGVGGALQRAAFSNLAPGGRLLVVGYISEYPHTQAGAAEPRSSGASSACEELPPSPELFWGGRTVEAAGGRVVYGSVWPSDRTDTLSAKARVFKLHDEGKLLAWVDGGAAFEGVGSVPDAVDYMLSGQAVGKVVVAL